MTTKLDARQTISRDTLAQLATATGTELDNLLRSINAEVTPPLVLTENTPADLIVNIGAITVSNPETSRTKSITPISNLIPTFAGGTVTLDATGAGNATPSSGNAIALGMSASQFLKLGISLDANGDLVLQAGTAGASEAAATNPPIVPNTHAIGYIVVETDGANNVQNLEATDIFQYFGSGGGGSGSGNANSDLETIKNMSDDSNWEFHTPYSFESDADALVDGASTGEFSLVSTRFVMDAAGETLVTSKMIDDEFTDLARDIPELEAVLIYDLANIDDSPTVEVSRNGGSLWEAVDSLDRVGDGTDTYYARHMFTDSEAAASIDADLTTDGQSELNTTDQQAFAQRFSFVDGSGSQVVQNARFGMIKTGSPLGTLRVAIHEDDGGAPGMLISKSADQDISGLSSGVQSIDVERVVIKDNTDYWLVISTDADYKASFVTSTTVVEVGTQSAGSNASDFDGSTWSAIAGGLQYAIFGHELDLRMRVTASDPTGDNAENEFRLRSVGLLYDRQLDGIIGLKKINRFDFSTSDNLSQFTLNFTPDPELLNIYYTQTGQVFKIDNKQVFISGKTVSFPVDTFDGGGATEDVTLIFAELQGTTFDNSDSNASKIVELEADVDALGEKTESLDTISVGMIPVPFTEVTGRALIKDLSKLPAPLLGVERVDLRWSDISVVEDEIDAVDGRFIYKSNDYLDRVRLVGNWRFTGGSLDESIVTTDEDDFLEITFYGTGLNYMASQFATDRDWFASVDGGPETDIYPSAIDVISTRNYRAHQRFNVASGLTLGVHTVKIRRGPAGTGMHFYGFEVLNESAALNIPAGDVIRKDERMSIPATTSAYNADFDASSDPLGTKGGRVVVYGERQLDGTMVIKKRFKAVDLTQGNLPAGADHSNEEIIRKVHFRDFGKGRGDDFSTLTDSADDKFYTLDDGATTLVGINVNSIAGPEFEHFRITSATNSVALTFVGTGLDLIAAKNTPAGFDSHTMEIDGDSIGTLSASDFNGDRVLTRIPIVSGLDYGTHTVRFTRDAFASGGLLFHEFITYGPAKPEIPADAVELGSYYLMADFSHDTTEGDIDKISAGVIRKQSSREIVYGGTGWSLDSFTSVAGGGRALSNTIGDDFSYTFHGTGFVYQQNTNASGADVDVYLDDGSGEVLLTAANFPTASFATSASLAYNSGTAALTKSGSTAGATFAVTGLALGTYTVRVESTSANDHQIHNFDVISPIHAEEATRNILRKRLVGGSSIRSELPVAERKQEPQYFLNGARIVGSVDGSMSTAGEIGEVIEVQDTTIRSASAVTASVWNDMGVSIIVPPGVWRLEWYASVQTSDASNMIAGNVFASLSREVDEETEPELTTFQQFDDTDDNLRTFMVPAGRSKIVNLTSTTKYHMITLSEFSAHDLYLRNDKAMGIIRATRIR